MKLAEKITCEKADANVSCFIESMKGDGLNAGFDQVFNLYNPVWIFTLVTLQKYFATSLALENVKG